MAAAPLSRIVLTQQEFGRIPDIRKQLQKRVVETVKEIVAFSNEALAQNRAPGKGIFYPTDYFDKLKATGNVKRLEFMKAKYHFVHGYLPPKLFEIMDNQTAPSGKQRIYTLKEGVKPSEALRALKGEELFILGCGEVCQIAQWDAICQLLGEEKFDTLFSRETKTPFKLGNTSHLPSLLSLKECQEESSIGLGDLVCFYSVTAYIEKHPLGLSRAFNTICIDDMKFTSLGLPAEGLTAEEMVQKLLNDYNAPQSDRPHLPDNVQKAYPQLYNNSVLTLEAFKLQGGGKRGEMVCEIDAKKMAFLSFRDAATGRAYLDNWA